MELFKNPNFDFLGKAKYFLVVSGLLVAAGIYAIASGQLRYGVEFSGGTQLILQFQTAPALEKIRDAVDRSAPGSVIQVFGQPADNKVLVRLAAQGDDSDLDAPARAALATLAEEYGDNPVIESSSEIVGPIVGAELRRKAILLVSLGLLFQLIYLAFRFKGGIWGLGAAIAALHDVVVALGILTFSGYEITLNIIAALLTLVGYSVNDTIVIFDRARENLGQRRKVSMSELLNSSINQTLSRTMITSGTTFLALLGLFLLGGDVLRGFSFALVVGTIVGTYSTMFVALPLVDWWYRRKGRSHAGATAPTGR
jgi:preprotein translocase subunit SecF